MDPLSTTAEFAAFDALCNSVLVLDRVGRILYASKGLSNVISNGKEVRIFDLLKDARLSEGLADHIRLSGDKQYSFSAILNDVPYHFNVTRWKSYYVCNCQSEPEIEHLYQEQVNNRKKLLDVKEKLLWLSKMDKNDFEEALSQILKTASTGLNCERVSYWEVGADYGKIVCRKLYLNSTGCLDDSNAGKEITRHDVPKYFEYITKEHAFILADDIETHSATAEFTDIYARPLNIKSLLDVPVWHNGKLQGIVCSEQVGEAKKWSLDDVRFALAIADNVSMCLQTRDRIMAEERLRETNKKLHRSNTDLEHFASVAAHDMKSPLRSIVSYLQIIKRQHGEVLGSTGVEYLNYTMQNATHLTQLINDLLAYSKLDQQISDAKPIDVNAMVSRITKEQEAYTAERKGKILVNDNMPILCVNDNMLYRLFSNIIHNAIKYSTDNVPPVLEIGYRCDDNFHYFEFADNGIGIDDQYAEKIFSLFGRLHGLEQFDGTGIGLATCKKIAELLGGKILYKRRTNPEGSVFTVMLPLALAEQGLPA